MVSAVAALRGYWRVCFGACLGVGASEYLEETDEEPCIAMEQIAYIQLGEDGRPYSANGSVAAKGFAALGYELRYFRRSELPGLPLTPDTVVAGGVGVMRAVFEQMGVRHPSTVSAPAALQPFLGRESWRTTLEEVRRAGRFPVFIKPYEDSKLFNGRVVADLEAFNRLAELTREGAPVIAEDVPILAQEPVRFQSEWRTFVIRGVVEGVSHYAGNPLLFPAANVIRMCLGAFTHAPAGYAADFGVTDDGRTVLVEINDGFSLGHGGLVANRYAELLRARWEEIVSGG